MYNTKFVITLQFFERFIFYSFTSILVLYLVAPEEASGENAIDSYGIFLNLIYFLPLIVGYLSDITNRRVIMNLGFILISLGLFLFASNSLSQEYTIPLLILIATGFAAIRPNLISNLIDGLTHKSPTQKIVGVVLFFGLINISAFFAPIFSQIFINNGEYNYVFIVLGILSISLSGILLSKKVDSSQQEISNNIQPKSNIKIVLFLLLFTLVYSLGHSSTNQLFNSQLRSSTYFIILQFFIWIVLLFTFTKLKIKTIDEYIRKGILIFSLFLGLKFIVYSIFNLSINQDSPIVLVLEILQLIPDLMLMPLVYLLFHNAFSKKYKITGMALVFIMSVIPYRTNYFIPSDLYYILAIICGLLIIFLGFVFNRSAEFTLELESST